MNNKNFYITTPIYYPSGQLQLGNTYTTVLADALARFQRMQGKEVFFSTGTDEHGLKIQQKAQENNQSEMQYLDSMIGQIKELWEKMGISYSKFIRTTDKYHEKKVQDIFSFLLKKGDIYKGTYKGWYSVSDEEFFTENQLKEVFRDDNGNVIGGIAPSGHEVEEVEEETYFFRMSKYSDWLLEYFKNNPNFLTPKSRVNEMINNFIKPGIDDLAITRTSFKWGIPVPGDEKHVIYVWLDALVNYITTLGYDVNKNKEDQSELFKQFWPANTMLIGKEIVRFHAIYLPIILHSLGLELPKQIIGHEWLVMKDGKMSKSKGNVVYPEILINRYGVDTVRYYLLKTMKIGSDGLFTPEDYISKINFDLANDLGNLVNRTISMANQYLDGSVDPKIKKRNSFSIKLENDIKSTFIKYKEQMNDSNTSEALDEVWKLISSTNKYIDETTPWKLAKEDKKDELKEIISTLYSSINAISLMLRPILINKAPEINEQLGIKQIDKFPDNSEDIINFEMDKKPIKKGNPIFPRLDMESETKELSEKIRNKKMDNDIKKENNNESIEVEEEFLDFNDFLKVQMVVGKILEVEPVENSNKLLKFQIEDGENSKRQILSGMQKHYPEYEKLVGKNIIFVKNLKPRKMAGKLSEGMILSAVDEESDTVTLSIVSDSIKPGSVIE